MDLISVIVPVYNGEVYIEECIDSIIKQSYKDLEIIILNDGSKDSTDSICKEFANRDGRINYIDQPNIGVSKTREKGIKIAKGEYIMFVDADDYLDETCIETLYEAMQRHNADVAACSVVDLEYGKATKKHLYENEVITDRNRLLGDFFKYKRYICTLWGKLYKKSLFERLVFPEMKYGEDSYIVNQVFHKADAVVLSSNVGYFYRIISSSATNTLSDYKKNLDLMKLAQMIYHMCKDGDSEYFLKACKKYEESIRAYIYTATKNIELAYSDKSIVSEYISEIRKSGTIRLKNKFLFDLYAFNPKIYALIFRIGRKNR